MSYSTNLVDSVLQSRRAAEVSGGYLDKVISLKLSSVSKLLADVHAQHAAKKLDLNELRKIESSDTRNVHFIFDPLQPCKISRFSRDLNALVQGNYEEQ